MALMTSTKTGIRTPIPDALGQSHLEVRKGVDFSQRRIRLSIPTPRPGPSGHREERDGFYFGRSTFRTLGTAPRKDGKRRKEQIHDLIGET